MTDEQQQQIELYGQFLTGDETELELARLARIQYLKSKMRPGLAAQIGDYGDNITDVLRAVVAGEAIRMGIVTDAGAISAHRAYIQAMLDGYGGIAAILPVLAKNVAGLQDTLVGRYYTAKGAIAQAQTIDEINAVDIE